MRDKVQPLTPAEPACGGHRPFPDDAAPAASLEPADGTKVWPEALPRARQEALVAALREALAKAPFYRVRMPRTGKPLSVSMTNLGRLGWISDKQGYRYEPRHPVTDQPWPPIPDSLLRLWNDLTGYAAPPEACLVNYYAEGARMGLHQDRDEEPMDAPVLSISLGDTAVFRLGGLERKGPTQSFRLHSGDIMMLAGASRLRFHGIDRILPGSSTLLEKGGRLNLTLRRVTAP